MTIIMKLMQLKNDIIAWDKVDANQIITTINDFYQLANSAPNIQILNTNDIPSEYIPKQLKQYVIATDKQKQCIFGETSPYSIKSIKDAKLLLK